MLALVTHYATYAKNVEARFVYAAYSPAEWFWIDSNDRKETIHLVEGYFGSESRAICNHCEKCFEKFLRVFGKTTPYA